MTENDLMNQIHTVILEKRLGVFDDSQEISDMLSGDGLLRVHTRGGSAY
jgi:hypothetical protein